MNTKLVCCVLVASLCFYIGCYSTERVTQEELKANVKQDIKVTTKDGSEYRFYEGDYSIQSDTLSGTGVQMIDGQPTNQHCHGSMLLADITGITTEKGDPGATITVIVALGLLVVIVMSQTIRFNFGG